MKIICNPIRNCINGGTETILNFGKKIPFKKITLIAGYCALYSLHPEPFLLTAAVSFCVLPTQAQEIANTADALLKKISNKIDDINILKKFRYVIYSACIAFTVFNVPTFMLITTYYAAIKIALYCRAWVFSPLHNHDENAV